MKKRVLSLLLAGVMTMGLLTGCGSDATENSQTPNESKTENSAESKEETSTEEETVTVKWLMWGDKAKDHDMVMEDLNKKLKEKINVELDLELIPAGEFNDKVKLASTAGEEFDIVFTASWRNNFVENVSRDAFLPLDELIAEYGKEMDEAIPDWLMTVGQVDGTQYAIPNQQITAKQLGFMVQKEYAEKYGLTATSFKSARDIEPFLDEIVKNEPEMFPIDMRQTYVDLTYDTFANNLAAIKLDSTDLKIESMYTAVLDEGARLLNDWYQKGYIRQDVATVTDNTADVKANRYVCTLNTYKPGWGAEQTAKLGKDYIDIPIEGAYVGSTSGIETMTAINVNSKNPEAAMKLLNLVYTDKEIFNELLFGIEGVHYNKTGDNSIEPISDTYAYGTMAWALGNQFNAYLLPGQEEDLWTKTDELNRTATVSPLRGFTFNPENVQAELAQLAAVVAEFKNGEYITDDIEQFIVDRTAKLEAAGLNTVLEEVQRQVDEWNASK